MPGGSWSRGRLSMPNENLMLIGRDCHCAPLRGFKIRPTSSQCQDLWSPKSKAWQCVSAFLGTQTESVRDTEGICKRDLNWLRIVTLLPYQQNSSRRLILHAVLYPMKAIKSGDWRLDLEFLVRAKLLSLGIRSSSVDSK